MSRNTVSGGAIEFQKNKPEDTTIGKERIRKPGGGRKRTIQKDPALKLNLEQLIEPVTRGDPESALLWTCKSVRRLAGELNKMGHKTSHRMVAELLDQMGYSLQANRKTKDGGLHPDRDAQFEYIHQKVKQFQSWSQPVISVDAKKKELVGNFKNQGREWRPKGKPEEVLVYDFESLGSGKVTPYAVYDLSQNKGWVSVGLDKDTAALAVASIRQWWIMMGSEVCPEAEQLLIISHEVIVNLIFSTKTKTGLEVGCGIDPNSYPKGIKMTEKDLKTVNILKDSFHGEWNYTIKPKVNVN